MSDLSGDEDIVMAVVMQQYGFRSLFVLAKIGYELRKEFADTFDEPIQDAFGPLIDALEDGKQVLSLASDEYEWGSNDNAFRYVSERR